MKLPARILIAISPLLIAIAGATVSPTPTPTPDLTSITEADILSTIAHRNALHEQLVDQVLPSASTDVKEAVAKAQTLQKQIDALALQAARVPVLEADLKKAHKACWRNLLIGAIGGAILVIVGPKLLALSSI